MKSGKRPISKQAAWRNRVIVIVVILLLAGGGAAWYFMIGPGAAQSSVVAGVETTYMTPVKRGDLRISAAGSGKLVAYQSVDLSFSVSGTVSALNVKAGDRVKAGQVLASLGSSQTLDASLASARLQLLNAQKTLTDLQQNADLSLAQAYSDLVSAQSSYDAALKKSERLGYARCSESTTKQLLATLDKARQKLDGVHAESNLSDVYIAAKKAYDTALANAQACQPYTTDEKNTVQSALDVAKNALQDAQDKYDTLKTASGVDPNELAMDEAKVKVAQAQLTKVQDQLEGVTLAAPMDGKVTYVANKVGAIVDTTKFITIADVSHAAVDISVDESDISKLVVGASAVVTFDALPDQSFTGKVIQANPQMTTSGQYRIAKGLVELDADAVKTISSLPLGLSATITIVNQEAKDALLVPVISLKDLGDNSYAVMVKGSDGQLKLQPVTVGIQSSDYAVITQGLKEGDVVSTGTKQFIAAGSSTDSNSLKNAQNQGSFPGGPGGPPAP